MGTVHSGAPFGRIGAKRPSVREAAETLFDNRLGWSDGRQPHAPRELWAELGEALGGRENAVIELREEENPGEG